VAEANVIGTFESKTLQVDGSNLIGAITNPARTGGSLHADCHFETAGTVDDSDFKKKFVAGIAFATA
ncbi:MAG: hypothetical protein HKM24_01620, partial [Gammaproteobacteria bacterium]|nr:hypothetical protein [Gammaproteobacteria bacterium]